MRPDQGFYLFTVRKDLCRHLIQCDLLVHDFSVPVIESLHDIDLLFNLCHQLLYHHLIDLHHDDQAVDARQ